MQTHDTDPQCHHCCKPEGQRRILPALSRSSFTKQMTANENRVALFIKKNHPNKWTALAKKLEAGAFRLVLEFLGQTPPELNWMGLSEKFQDPRNFQFVYIGS